MTSIKVRFRPSAAEGAKGTIFYQVIHGRRVRQLRTGYRVYRSEWDGACLAVDSVRGPQRAGEIASMLKAMRLDMARMARVKGRMDSSGMAYTADDLVEEFLRNSCESFLTSFMGDVIGRLRHNGRLGTADAYVSALNSFRRFTGGRDVMLDSMDSELMEAYEAHLQKRGVTPNTTSFYMRILRAVYNRAVDRGLEEPGNPFRHVYTGVDKTVKRALPLAAVKRMKSLDLHASKDFARDMFMMSFYLRGMSFIDMAFLKKTDLRNGYITYRRRKTGQQLIIEWTKEMQMLLDKYPENASGYLLPIIRKTGINERCAYRNACYNINHNLKKIGEMIGIKTPLTLYVARHSWASAARTKGIPLSVISEGMGHDSESTTRIYLSSLETSLVDKANSIILDSL